MLTSDELEKLLVSVLSNSVTEKKTCVALSGGVDSTLLTTLLQVHKLIPDLVAYTAKTHEGNDLYYAQMAAKELGVELRVVEVPIGRQALDMHWDLSVSAGAALSLVGNSIGFAAICHHAKNDGFDCIVDGTGAEQISGGNGRLADDYLKLAYVAQRLDLVEQFETKNKRHKLKKNAVRKLVPSMYEAIESDLQNPAFLKWFNHHKITERATEIRIIMPFLNSSLEPLKRQPLEFYYPNGWTKGQFRKILNRYLPEEIAYRTDNQGLRWPRKKALVGCKTIMRQRIKSSGVLGVAALSTRFVFKLGLIPFSSTIRLYEQAVGHAIVTNLSLP